MRSLQVKAKLNNVIFHPIEVVTQDWLIDIGSLISIIICLFFIDSVLKIRPDAVNYLKIFFAFIGYTGSDVLSRLFSVVNNRLNAAIGYKTKQTDEANGTTDKPTPK